MLEKIITIIAIASVLGVWLSTLRFHELPHGQLFALKRFGRIVAVLGCGIKPIPIPEDRFPADVLIDGQPIKIRVDADREWIITIWPWKIAVSEYRYKKFRPYKDVVATGGSVVWPEPKKGKDGKEIKFAPDEIVLGEWKEIKKKSLFVREREEIAIKFRSVDGVHASVKAYVKYLLWDLAAAVSTTYQFKIDPEKVIMDKFQDWAKEKKYFKEINGISFEKIMPDRAKDFFIALNKDIYLTGPIVEDVELFDFIIDPRSEDVAEAQEAIIENEFLLAAEEVESKRKKVEGQGTKDKQLLENEAKQDLLTKEATVVVNKDRDLKSNEVTQAEALRQITVKEDGGLKENETKQYGEMKTIDLNNNKLLIEKLIEYKKAPDVTEIKKTLNLGKVQGTLIYHEAGGKQGSNFDNELLETVITGNEITKTKKGGEK